MGNAALREIAVINSVSFDELAGNTIAVDAHNWLFKYLTITVRFNQTDMYTTSEGIEVANLIGIIRGLPKFLEAEITPIFVFDGTPTDLKSDEIEARREQRERNKEKLEAAREAEDQIEIARYESQTQRLTETIHTTTRELLSRLDIPMVEAPAEGEAQASYMARHDPMIDAVGSDDYDTLLFGAPVTIRGLTSKGDPERMEFEATLTKHELTWEQLVDVGMLCGTDFNEGVSGIGPKTAIKAIHEHDDLWGVLDAYDETIAYADRIRELFLQPTVETEYEIDPDITPDLDAAIEYVTEQWEVPLSAVERGFSRIESSTLQTGLDQFG